MSYKRLGDFIQQVNVRNTDLKILNLQGLSMIKEFRKSTSNIVGTDLSKYKIVKKGQFCCDFMSVIRVHKLPVVLNNLEEDVIISPAYVVFEIIDENLLLPEYLMMWFRREEFDRYADFRCDSSIRGGFQWEELCDVSLPIPSIEKQREIVAQYQSIEAKIKTNEALCQKLEATAQTLYKHWFVDFEFPNENGKPYFSSGGEMVYHEELQKEIPKGWEDGKLEDIMVNFDSQRRPITSSDRVAGKYPYYGAAALMDYVEDYIFDGTFILLGEDGTVMNKDGSPVLQYVWGKIWVNNHAHVLQGKNGFDENSLYLLLKQTNVSEIITGGVQAKINQTNLNSLAILRMNEKVLKDFNQKVYPLFEHIKNLKTQTQTLKKLQSLLLVKMGEYL